MVLMILIDASRDWEGIQWIANTTPLDANATFFSYMVYVELGLNAISISVVLAMLMILVHSFEVFRYRPKMPYMIINLENKDGITIKYILLLGIWGISLLCFHFKTFIHFSKMLKFHFEYNKSFYSNEEDEIPIIWVTMFPQ